MDIIGARFGLLTVLSQFRKNNVTFCTCLCTCGNESTARKSNLVTGNTTSCGCHRKRVSKERFTTHGMRQSAEYLAWAGLLGRCRAIKGKDFHWYAARGIKVCKEWEESFEAFYRDMGQRPSPRHSIGRIDNDKGYDLENCHWETPTEQANNRRSNHQVLFRGKMMTLRQILNETGAAISYKTLAARVFASGWSIEDALSEPVQRNSRWH